MYIVPLIPVEESADRPGIARFWQEVDEKLVHFSERFGNARILFHEGVDYEAGTGFNFLKEHLGEESGHFKVIKNLVEKGAEVKPLEKEEVMRKLKILMEEYSRSFLPETEGIYKGYFGEKIDFNGWKEYLVEQIKETSENLDNEVTEAVDKNLQPGDAAVLFITDGRKINMPASIEIFNIRPPSLDDLYRLLKRDLLKQHP